MSIAKDILICAGLILWILYTMGEWIASWREVHKDEDYREYFDKEEDPLLTLNHAMNNFCEHRNCEENCEFWDKRKSYYRCPVDELRKKITRISLHRVFNMEKDNDKD